MRLTIRIPTYIEVDKFKKDHKAFLKYLSKHCTYSIEQSSNGYGYTSFVCGPVREKSLHAFIDNYFKLFLEEIDEMKDTDFERLCESKPGLQYDFKFFTPVSLEEIAAISPNYTAKRHPNNCDYDQHLKDISIWKQFKALHPNTPENPDYSEASVKRWLYHINEAEKNKGFEKAELDMRPIEALRSIRRVKKFEDFTEEQKMNYRAISIWFSGIQVFACGSQVRGDYIPMDGSIIAVKARELAGMRANGISDYDYWVHPSIPTPNPMPCNSDRYRGKFNEKEMVAVPIYYGDV